jgi:hypothetical protein
MADTGQTVWDTSLVSDGWHRIEVVAYEDTPLYSQATEGIDVYVDNHGLSLMITDPVGGARVSGIFPVTVEAVGDVIGVILESEGLQLGLAPGSSPFVVDVDSARLGRGLHTLVARGMGSVEVRSPEEDVFVVVEPQIYSPGGVPSVDPPDGPSTGGTLVTIRGWNFEPGIRVFFAGIEAPLVNRVDANTLEAETPPGPPGLVELRVENPTGPASSAPDAFTYTAVPCAMTLSIEELTVAREGTGQLRLDWPVPPDPCLGIYRTYALADPDLAGFPLFPDDFPDVTDQDEDGDVGGDPSFLWTPGAGTLVLFQTVGEGTDGALGPR